MQPIKRFSKAKNRNPSWDTGVYFCLYSSKCLDVRSSRALLSATPSLNVQRNSEPKLLSCLLNCHWTACAIDITPSAAVNIPRWNLPTRVRLGDSKACGIGILNSSKISMLFFDSVAFLLPRRCQFRFNRTFDIRCMSSCYVHFSVGHIPHTRSRWNIFISFLTGENSFWMDFVTPPATVRQICH